jgi:hypothetical protein
MTAAEKSADRGDLGSALLSGMLQAADGAPPPPAMHPDPMMDFYGSLCADFIPEMAVGSTNHWDPMLEEMETWCDREIAVTRPLSFSPLPPRSDEMVRSPEYTPQSALWDRVADLNTEAAALGINNVVHFGPGVQLTKEVGGKIVTAGITEQVAQMMLDERRNTIVDSMFVPCEQPVLPDPAHPAARGRARERAAGKATVGTRRSTRQMKLACSVPVSKRAAHRLIRAFEMAGPSEPIGDQAMEAYVRSFQTPMTEKAVKAVRMLTSLDSGPALAASAQLLEAEGGADMEETVA